MSRKTAPRRIALAVFLCLLLIGVANATDHFAAPNGSPGGNGSLSNPWDLQTAFNQSSAILPGDNLWLLGGTYVAPTVNGFSSSLTGTTQSPIVIRNYQGQRVTIDGQKTAMGITITGSYSWFWGLEIMSSCTQRTPGSDTPICAPGIEDEGGNNKFINLIVHDTAQGIAAYNASPNSEFYGNLVYYNGYVGTSRNFGHGFYLQNDTGTKTVSDNFVFDNADEGVQIYGSGNADLIGFSVIGNDLFDTSSWPYPHYQYNLIIAGGQNRQNIAVQNNFDYFPPGANDEGFGAQLGQYTNGEDMTVTGNIFVGGYAPLTFTDQLGPVVFTGNTVVGSTDSLRVATLDLWSGESTSNYTWDQNTYYDQSMLHFFEGFTTDGSDFSGTNSSFAGWQGLGFDLHGTYYANAPAGQWVYVRPNQFEAKRGNITVFNWSLASTVSVDLSSVLNPGDQYVIQDAQNFFGAPVASGVYSGSPVSISMNGLTKAAPVGFAAPAHTAPKFGTFVVLPAGATAAALYGSNTPPAGGSGSGGSGSTGTTSAPTPTATAAFIGTNTSAQGNWQSVAGTDGYSLAASTQSLPSYATSFTVQNAQTWTWAATTTDPRALATGSSSRTAAAWYVNSGTFTFNVSLASGSTHQISLYAVDWDSKGRAETIQVVDAGTGIVLNTQAISNFTNGIYLQWTVSGNVQITVTPTAGANAVVSGVFFGAGSGAATSSGGGSSSTGTGTGTPTAGNTAQFVTTDTSTQGNWQGKYGADGYAVAGFPAQDTPSYSSFAFQNQANWTWASSTTDVRAPETPGSTTSRIAGAWYNTPSFSLNLNFTDGNAHQFAIYAVDYDFKGRAETVQILDGTTGAVLDTENISNFTSGVYLVWNVSGHLKVVFTVTAGANAELTGLFFGTGTPNTNTANAAAFVATDTTTQGNWIGVYGKDAFEIPDTSSNVPPSYAAFTPQNQANYLWTTSTAAAPALEVAGSTSSFTRQASCWYTSGTTSYSLDLNLTDGNAHQFELYALDWDTQGRAETIQVVDGSTGAVLDTRTVTNFTQGIYYIWKVAGHVKFNISVTAGPNAVISGAFFN